MFIILAYDVEEKRTAKIRKIAEKYLNPIQRSLFHGFLTEKQLFRLKSEIERIVDKENDSITIYKLCEGMPTIEELGFIQNQNRYIL